MKTNSKCLRRAFLFTLAALCVAMISQAAMNAADNATPAKTRVGVYDSRAVALAYGRSKMFQEKANKLFADAKQAKAAGDKERLAQLQKEGPALQDKMHRQVFGDAPIDDVLETIKDALPEIQKKAGVQTLAPKAPAGPGVEVVDVTPLLVEQFHPTKQTLKMIEDLKKHPPLSPDKFPIKD